MRRSWAIGAHKAAPRLLHAAARHAPWSEALAFAMVFGALGIVVSERSSMDRLLVRSRAAHRAYLLEYPARAAAEREGLMEDVRLRGHANGWEVRKFVFETTDHDENVVIETL